MWYFLLDDADKLCTIPACDSKLNEETQMIAACPFNSLHVRRISPPQVADRSAMEISVNRVKAVFAPGLLRVNAAGLFGG